MKNNFKIILAMASLILISSCSYLGLRSPSSTTKKHYIITMHGVRGNAESYGEFHSFVGKTLKEIDSTYEYELFNWTYPVGAAVNDEENNINWDPHLIADKFNKDFFLGNKGKRALLPELGPEDKISIIAYSMGGQMAMTWYYDTMFNFKFHPNMSYGSEDAAKVQNALARVENMIGLGPVFWGSIEAELGWSFLEKGDVTQLRKAVEKTKPLCNSPEVLSITGGQGFVSNVYEGVKNKVFGDEEKKLTEDEKKDRAIRNILIAACGPQRSSIVQGVLKNTEKAPDFLVSQVHKIMKSVGNMNPSEMNHMRLTSDVINEIRVNRISHLIMDQYRQKYRAKWTSIVGVFPCLNKKDAGLTCNEFKTEEFKKVNNQIVTLLSGHKRNETDGPVFSPGAVADFLFYIENPGKESQPIDANSFVNTADLQKTISAPSREVFVENMHATLVPALTGLTGVLAPVGQDAANSLLNFDKSLGSDVVIMNKECLNPKTCEHPNFKSVVETLTGCVPGRVDCNQSFVNEYFKVSNENDRYVENDKLHRELGTYALVLNIRLPKSYRGDLSTSDKILKAVTVVNAKRSVNALLDNRVDAASSLYANQINRSLQLMGSYAVVKDYNDSRVVRLFLLGRIWPKPVLSLENMAKVRAQLEDGVPVALNIKFPGLTSTRSITAKVRPTYTTYADIYMK